MAEVETEMGLESIVDGGIGEHIEVVSLLGTTLAPSVVEVGQVLSAALAEGGTIFWCGNGGSASDSQHIAAELIGRFKKNRRPLRSVALNTDTSVLTCIANDFGYDEVFRRQVEALGRPGDVLVGISTSGRSANLNATFEAASACDMATVGLLGRDGGQSLALVDHSIVVPSDSTARIQECHILIGHLLCEIIERELDLA